MSRNWPILLVVGILFAGLGAYFGGAFAPPQRDDPVARLFASSLPDPLGRPQKLAQWKGKTVLINFWATWCAPCVDEMPELQELQNQIAPGGKQIIGIGVDTASNIAQFSTKYKISYPLYVGGMGATDLSREFGNQLSGLPFSVLISPEGRILKTYTGRLKLADLRSDLAAAP
jgi:thiol-disulfide isomerase/thioredoxin